MILRASLLIVLALCLASPAAGQMPEPYGAWRGKIRYTEGPFRTRTHVRWGGGITPVGGQVLMHLGTVAGNVATSPNLWSGISGLPAPQRDAQLNPQLTGTVAEIQATNLKLLADLNTLRARPGIELPPLAFTAIAPGPAPGAAPGMPPPPTDVVPGAAPVPAQGNFQQRLEEWQSAGTELEQLRVHIGTQLATALAVADAIADPAALDAMKVASVRQAAASPLFAGSNAAGGVVNSPAQFETSYSEAKQNLEVLKARLQSTASAGQQLRQEDPQTFERPERQQLLTRLQQDLAAAQRIQL